MMIDEILELAAELAATTRAYLYAELRGWDTTALRERLHQLLEECSLRNL